MKTYIELFKNTDDSILTMPRPGVGSNGWRPGKRKQAQLMAWRF